MAQRNYKSYEELQFADDFMFKRVMADPEICKGVLERLLGIQIEHISYPETEKIFENAPDSRGIRLDVYLTGDSTKYDIEMQAKLQSAIGKRSRYYQSSVDLDAIGKGDSFLDLNDSMIIFICTFDPFHAGLHRYTFRQQCEESSDIYLQDGTSKIIFNTQGTQNDVAPEVIHFLKFVENLDAAGNDEFLLSIRNKIKAERMSIEGRQEYTMFQMVYNDMLIEGKELGRTEGRTEGLAEGLAEGRTEGLAEGRAEGIETAKKVLIETCQELGLSKENAKKKLVEKFGPENAEETLNRYWKSDL